MQDTTFRREFVEFAVKEQVLLFGDFRTKAGRQSPYFYNSGLFNTGASFLALSRFYAKSVLASGIRYDVLFGPAYKGITLAAGTAMALAELGHNVPFCFNRKEAKDHGEGGNLVGAPLKGRALIVDDVISAGTAVRESVETILHAGAKPAGVVIALDRMERGGNATELTELSATQEVSRTYGIPVIAIATLNDILDYARSLQGSPGHDLVSRIEAYRQRYGA